MGGRPVTAQCALDRAVRQLQLPLPAFPRTAVPSQPARLTPFVHAITSLLFPLKWSHINAPLLPPSHAAVASAPFPFILGIPLHEASFTALGRPPPSKVGATVTGVTPGELWVMLDSGSCYGAPLAPLPDKIATNLKARCARLRAVPPTAQHSPPLLVPRAGRP